MEGGDKKNPKYLDFLNIFFRVFVRLDFRFSFNDGPTVNTQNFIIPDPFELIAQFQVISTFHGPLCQNEISQEQKGIGRFQSRWASARFGVE